MEREELITLMLIDSGMIEIHTHDGTVFKVPCEDVNKYHVGNIVKVNIK